MSASIDFDVSPEDINLVAGRCTSVGETLQGDLGKLRGYVEMLSAAWYGKASIAFNGTMVRYDYSSRELVDALMRIGDELRRNAVTYEASDADSTSIIGSQDASNARN